MSKNKIRLNNVFRQLKHRSVEFNVDPYEPLLNKISEIDLSAHTDRQLQELSRRLLVQARQGVPLNDLLFEAFALVREASGRILHMWHFDVQILAGLAMHFGGMVEMQTGEGKTLTAVLPAYLNALSGKGVHILTFNDYLAQRDAEWMGPVYRFLGLSAGFVREGMTLAERRYAYRADVTYLTAKEAGFDYLKSFLVLDREEWVHRPFHYAIVDEADSILIDEARIPLVIAGRTEEDGPEPVHIARLVKNLVPHRDYEMDEYARNVFLTESGSRRVEAALGCGNIFDERNLRQLVEVNNALHAEALLKRDVDYIVRDGRIELVDEFTGRIADKRHWPHGLQEAVEAKEGIESQSKGQILASITLNHFIRLYPKVCGMTGTALTASDEFAEFYGLRVVVIPTNRPCIRVDHPDWVFTHKEAKNRALVEEIRRVHSTGRPILVGTGSVEESEHLAALLKEAGVECRVLNAKNDALEARIVSEAGALGALTVSTNMAGRGTDIKLGGETEADREQVVALGGLYVIGTNRHESRRIDNQLRGRAGRQGDPGSSRFFISLEDDLMLRYRLKELIPEPFYPKNQDVPVENKVLHKEIARAQRIIEGQNYDARRMIGKYAVVTEQQRQKIYNWRTGLLSGALIPCVMKERMAERYQALLPTAGEAGLRKAETQVTLYFINRCWSDYLDYLSYIRETIHLVNMAGKVPVTEFNRQAVNSFDKLIEEITEEVVKTLMRVEITADGVDMARAGLHAPTSTWTYLVNDGPEAMGIMRVPAVFDPMSALIMGPLIFGVGLYNRFYKKRRPPEEEAGEE